MSKIPAYPLYLAMRLASGFCFSLIFTASALYQVTVAHLTPLQLVLIGTGLEATIFLFEIPTGVVADVYSRKLSIVSGTLIIGLGFTLEGSIPQFWAILLGQMLWGLGYTFTSGATQAWLTDEIGEAAANRALLRGGQVDTVGNLFGVGAAVLIGGLAVNLPIIAGGLLLVLQALALALWMPETGFHPLPREDRNTWQHLSATFRRGLGMVRQRPALWLIFAIGLFYGLYSEGYDRLWPKHLLDNIGLPESIPLTPIAWFGLINIIGMFLSIAVTELARRRVQTGDPRSVRRALTGLTGLIIAGLLAFAWASLLPPGVGFVAALLAMWMVDVTRGVVGPLYEAWVNQRLDASVRATILSMSGQVDAIGQVAGGPLVGVVGNTSVRLALTMSAGLLCPAAILARHAAQDETEIVGQSS
jgi:DHA3 family tetracycline resistance protein-like MFS transporter